MRILVCSNTYPPLAMGGYELLCQEHVAWLRQRGAETLVLTSRFGLAPEAPREESGAAGERVVRELDLHWRDFQHHRPNLATVWTHERRQRIAVERLLGELRPHVCLVWGMGAISKSVLATVHAARVPMLAVVGEHWPVWDVASDRWARLFAHLPLRWLSRPASWAIAPTDIDGAMHSILPLYASDNLRQVIEAAVPAWRGRGQVVRNGIRAERFVPARPRAGGLGRPLRLLYAGRIERRKGAMTAIEALPALERLQIDVTLSLVGWPDADFVLELRRLAAELGVEDRIQWQEPVARDQMARVYGAHDVLVFPTLWDEPFGLVPLEAMAAGCCVVATGTGGSGEYLADEHNALVFSKGNSAALALAVSRLAGDDGLVERLRQGGRETAARHTFEAYARTIDLLIRETAGVKDVHNAPAPVAAGARTS
jgi:glycosyltransferase involved in cell wall biosynthesis